MRPLQKSGFARGFIVELTLKAKAELEREKHCLRLLFRGMQDRKRGQEMQLEVVRAEKKQRMNEETGRKVELRNWGLASPEQPPRILEEEDLLMLRNQREQAKRSQTANAASAAAAAAAASETH